MVFLYSLVGGVFFRDLHWFMKLFNIFNDGSSFSLIDYNSIQHVTVNASLVGIGVVWKDRAYAETIQGDIKSESTIHFKMYNIVIIC